MSNITFDSEGTTNLEKESIEWIRIWCEDTNDNELPRVSLIGDSITEGYYGMVKEALKDIAKVDYLATSYSVASDMYQGCVEHFMKDSVYTPLSVEISTFRSTMNLLKAYKYAKEPI